MRVPSPLSRSPGCSGGSLRASGSRARLLACTPIQCVRVARLVSCACHLVLKKLGRSDTRGEGLTERFLACDARMPDPRIHLTQRRKSERRRSWRLEARPRPSVLDARPPLRRDWWGTARGCPSPACLQRSWWFPQRGTRNQSFASWSFITRTRLICTRHRRDTGARAALVSFKLGPAEFTALDQFERARRGRSQTLSDTGPVNYTMNTFLVSLLTYIIHHPQTPKA